MALKLYQPTTPARRGMTTQDTKSLTTNTPTKSLLVPKNRTSGRNAQGKITIRHRGGGAKRRYRLMDFAFAQGTSGTIKTVEYDPNRTARISLVDLEAGGQTYVLAGSGMKVGTKISSGAEVEIKPGNRLPLKAIPQGTPVYNIELTPGRGGQMARSAGTKAILAAKEGEFAQLRLPSGEVRLVRLDCLATIGTVGNEGHQNIKYGSAGRKRRMGRRPQVRGKAMNPVDHPHGGGEGGMDIGLPQPRTPWGKPALGLKTRKRKSTNKMIVRRRGAGRRG